MFVKDFLINKGKKLLKYNQCAIIATAHILRIMSFENVMIFNTGN
jgi:hypothetical protein